MAGPKKVLIVDDEVDLRSIVRLTLQSAGFQVQEATNGKHALGELERELPDLMILDIMMPKMNGIELCRAMIDKLGVTDLPVLVVSAISDKSKIIGEFFDLPLPKKSFLRKPLDTRDLLLRVEDLIGKADASTGAPAPQSKPAAPPAPAAESPEPAAPRKPQPRQTRQAPPSPAPQAPKAPEPSGEEPKPSPGKDVPEGPRYRVLVIDDEEDIRLLLKTTLSMRHTVETAENGMDALDKIDDFNPDFTLSDINMPVMNGLETIEAIRRHPRFHDIPVFFLTGEKDQNLPKKAFGLGANLFLRKPIEPMQLLKTVDYFVKEAKLRPRQIPPKPAPSKDQKAPETKGPSAGTGRVRVLVVDENPDTTQVLRKAMPESDQAPWETLWSHEVQMALGNLKLWEPDVIFFNPRNTHMDGIAFVQTLRLKKLDKNYRIVFTGASFYDADITYSKRNLGMDVLRLDAPEEKVAEMVESVVRSVEGKIKPKQRSVVEIEREHEAVRKRQAKDKNKAEKQRELFRQRFARIQNFIDASHRHD